MNNTQFFVNDIDAPKPNKPNHIGTTIIITYKDSVLMDLRADCGVWSFIGGGLNIDETLIDCACREVLEETGISVNKNDLTFLNIYDNPMRIIKYPDGNIIRCITVVYILNLSDEPDLKCSEESFNIKFIPINELKDLDIVKTHMQIAEDFTRNTL